MPVTVALAALGLAGIAYGAAMGVLYPSGKFFLIWIVLGALLIGVAAARATGTWQYVPLAARRGLLIATTMALAGIVVLAGLIAGAATTAPPRDADYAIVLGARLRRDGRPRKALRFRLDAALTYLDENPRTLCIVSGGQGSDEPRTEAASMAEYLVERGISPSRIILENRSTTTEENLRFSKDLMDSPEATVVVATSDFHAFRALHLARGQGLANAHALPARSEAIYYPQAGLRECLAIVKDALAGNLA